jgi:hypothetical protein
VDGCARKALLRSRTTNARSLHAPAERRVCCRAYRRIFDGSHRLAPLALRLRPRVKLAAARRGAAAAAAVAHGHARAGGLRPPGADRVEVRVVAAVAVSSREQRLKSGGRRRSRSVGGRDRRA